MTRPAPRICRWERESERASECIHTHTHTHIPVCIHTHIHNAYIHTCIHIYITYASRSKRAVPPRAPRPNWLIMPVCKVGACEGEGGGEGGLARMQLGMLRRGREGEGGGGEGGGTGHV
jgi:hypothetical protein